MCRSGYFCGGRFVLVRVVARLPNLVDHGHDRDDDDAKHDESKVVLHYRKVACVRGVVTVLASTL